MSPRDAFPRPSLTAIKEISARIERESLSADELDRLHAELHRAVRLLRANAGRSTTSPSAGWEGSR